ncbi:MAG: tol-pal system-associated acyl-CoA thioesterase [Alphaproteobacteria bacterium]|nr:tol-pal system-associated acyl-CoA thioesterase [Alphaproteobacteria bacterium]
MVKLYKLPIRIYYEDTDAGGIVYYANYLKFAERARTEFVRSLGFEQREDLESDDKFGFIVRRAELEYLKPSRLDDLIEISCEVEDVKGATVEACQIVSCNGEERVKIKVTLVYISLAKMRPQRVPEKMVEKLWEYKREVL